MRKILTVLCLALALCLLCGYALAANDPYGDSHFESVDALDALKDAAYKDIGKVEGHEDLTEKTKTAKCGEYVEVDVYGTTTQGTETKTVHAKAYVILKAHKWVNASTSEKWDVAPTCTEKGKDNKQCSNCKATEFVADIPALGHAFELAYAEGKEPTCTKDGAKIMTCIRCKVTDGEEIKVDKLAHDYTKLNFTEPKCAPNDQSTGAAAIMKDGQYYYTCSVCGKKEVTVDAEGKETEVAPEVVTLKQYQEGFTDKKNTATKPIKAPEGYDGHDWTEWLPTKAATCTAYAKERRFCKRCTMEEWREDKESGYADHKFDVDSSKPFNCLTTAADVTVYCTTESTATNKVLPAGYTKAIVDEVVKDNVTVSPKVLQVKDPKGNVVYEFALPHSWKVKLDADKKEVRTKATCTKAATVTMVCEFCNTPERVIEEGKPLGHDLSDWKKETDTADSTVWNRVCNRCHEVAETYVGKVPPCRENEHNYVFDDKYVCGEEKVYKYTCSVCGMATTKKEKFEHDYSKNILKVATCKEDGIEIWTCKLCNETLVKYPSHTEVEHTWTVIPAVEVTCTKDGATAGRVCSVCGVKEGCEVVKAPGQHTYEVVEGKDATCTEKGFTSSVKCSACGEILMPATEIEALGHKEVVKEGKAATCTEAGLTDGKACERCGLVIEEQKQIKALGHKWDDGKITKEAAPHVDGEKTFTCTVCGATNVEPIPALSHTYEAEIVTEATCTKEGKKLLTCTVCGYVTTEPIAKIAHTPVKIDAVAPTCLVDGKTEGEKCSVCGEILKAQEVVKAAGAHDYQKIEAVEATCTEAGSTEGVVCAVCGEALIAPEKVEALGHKEVVKEGKAATCTEAGLTDGKVCERCGLVIEEQKKIEALGHKWDEGKVTKEATPDEKGEKLYTCTVCEETKTEEFEFVATEDPKYEVKDAEYDGDEGVGIVSGKVAHDPNTKVAGTTYARVTFFMADGSFVAFATVIDEDGNFEAMTSGEVVHIAIQITDSTKVRPGEFDSFGSTEFDVE